MVSLPHVSVVWHSSIDSDYKACNTDWSTEVLESKIPLSLSAFHGWVGGKLPTGTLRAKGVLYVREDPVHRYVFQLSGKQRLEMTNTGRWPCTPSTKLAIIGTGFNLPQIQADLKALVDPAAPELLSHIDACVEFLTLDNRFEVLGSSSTEIHFRMRCPLTILDETMQRHVHHLDMNALNEQLATEVNSHGSGALLWSRQIRENEDSPPIIKLVASAAGTHTLLTMWPIVDARAKAILYDVRKKLSECMCGF